jgi:hypothetical protein
MTEPLKRKPLPDDRTGNTRRFTLPIKRQDGIAPELKEGLLALKQLGDHTLRDNASRLDEAARVNLATAIRWIENIAAPQPEAERMKIYFTVGVYPDGQLGEIFIRADRSGSLASGALDAVAMLMSIGLQYGVPLQVMLEKLRHSRFEPEGYTRDGEFPSASSPLDLLAQWLGSKFSPKKED